MLLVPPPPPVHLGMSPLLVGLTIVAMGTSAPEIFVSIMAALDGAGNLAVGNALGSNITNIGLVLGITALISPIPLQKKLLKKELPLLVLVSIIGGLVLMDLQLNLTDALILFAAMGLCPLYPDVSWIPANPVNPLSMKTKPLPLKAPPCAKPCC